MIRRSFKFVGIDESPKISINWNRRFAKNFDLPKNRGLTGSGSWVLDKPDLTFTLQIQCSVACGHGYQQRQVKCQTHDGRLSTHCHKAYRPVSKQNCRGQRCNEGANDPLPTDDKCVDINKVAYCPLGTDLNQNSTGFETPWYRGAHNDL